MARNFNVQLADDLPKSVEELHATRGGWYNEEDDGLPEDRAIQKIYKGDGVDFSQYMPFQNPYIRIESDTITLIFPRKNTNKNFMDQLMAFIESPKITEEMQLSFNNMDPVLRDIVTCSLELLPHKVQHPSRASDLLNVVCINNSFIYAAENYLGEKKGTVDIKNATEHLAAIKQLLSSIETKITRASVLEILTNHLRAQKFDYKIEHSKETCIANVIFAKPLTFAEFNNVFIKTIEYELLVTIPKTFKSLKNRLYFLDINYKVTDYNIKLFISSPLIEDKAAITKHLQTSYPETTLEGNAIIFDLQWCFENKKKINDLNLYYSCCDALLANNIVVLLPRNDFYSVPGLSEDTVALYIEQIDVSMVLSTILEQLRSYKDCKLKVFEIMEPPPEDNDGLEARPMPFEMYDEDTEMYEQIQEIADKNFTQTKKARTEKPGL